MRFIFSKDHFSRSFLSLSIISSITLTLKFKPWLDIEKTNLLHFEFKPKIKKKRSNVAFAATLGGVMGHC